MTQAVMRALRSHTGFFESFICILGLGWFSILALPFSSIAVSPGYRIMAVLAPEWAWALIGLLCFAALAIGLLYDSRAFRSLGIGLSAVLWLVVSMTILVANPLAMGWWAYLTMAAFCAISYKRLQDGC